MALLGGSHVALALLAGLEATVAELGAGVDELEGDLLGGRAGGALVQRLAQGNHTLLGADNAS